MCNVPKGKCQGKQEAEEVNAHTNECCVCDLSTNKMRTVSAEELFNDMRDELRDLHNKVDVLWREYVRIEEPPLKPAKFLTVDEVAQMLYEIFDDDCACNFNGNDEWLPEVCEYCDSYCPNPPEKLDCWKQFVLNFDYKRQFDAENS